MREQEQRRRTEGVGGEKKKKHVIISSVRCPREGERDEEREDTTSEREGTSCIVAEP